MWQLLDSLSKREKEVYIRTLAGLDVGYIANTLKLSKPTVYTYLYGIYTKMMVGSLAELISQWHGMINRDRMNADLEGQELLREIKKMVSRRARIIKIMNCNLR